MANDVSIVRIDAQHAVELSMLCHEIYPQFFTYLWDDDGEWYLRTFYNAEVLKAELEDPNSMYFFLVKQGRRIGYLKLNLDKSIGNDAGGLEIERIYLSREFIGQGLGRHLMNFALDVARQRLAQYVWLHVMFSSVESIAFYSANGFAVVGETFLTFEHMLPRYRLMWKMKKQIQESTFE